MMIVSREETCKGPSGSPGEKGGALHYSKQTIFYENSLNLKITPKHAQNWYICPVTFNLIQNFAKS